MSQLKIGSPKHCAAKQAHYYNPSSNLYKKILFLLSSIFTTLLALILLVWLLLHPSKPSFSLQQTSIYSLSLSNSPSQLNSSIQLTFLVSNPNSRLGVYYDDLRVYAYYKGQQITNQVSFLPFYQGPRDSNELSASLGGSDLPVTPYFGSEVVRDQLAGKLVIGFKVDGRIRWKVGTWVSGKYRLNVDCVTAMDFGPGLPTGPLTSRQGSQCSTTL